MIVDLAHLLSTFSEASLYCIAGLNPCWLSYMRPRVCLMVRHAGDFPGMPGCCTFPLSD